MSPSRPNFTHILQKLRQFEDHNQWHVTGPVIKSRQCNIYQAQSPFLAKKLAIKHYHATSGNMAPQRQFAALERYQAAMAKRQFNFRVPETYLFDAEQSCIVMEWICGTSLHRQLWNPGGARPSVRKELLKKTGAWLREFHAVTGIETTETSRASFLTGTSRQLEKIGQSPRKSAASDPLFMRVHNGLQKMTAVNEQFQLPSAILHGDFTPFNLHISAQTVIGVDIWANGRGPIFSDLARMLVYLSIAYPLLNRPPLYAPSDRFSDSLMPLLQGYGPDLIDPQTDVFKITLAAEYLRRWLVISMRSRNLKRTFTDRYQMLQIRKQLKTLLRFI